MVEPRFVNGQEVIDTPDRLALAVEEHPYDHLGETRLAIKLKDGQIPHDVRDAVSDPTRDGETVVADYLRDNDQFRAWELRHFLSADVTDSGKKEPHKRYAIEIHPVQLQGFRRHFATAARYTPDELLTR